MYDGGLIEHCRAAIAFATRDAISSLQRGRYLISLRRKRADAIAQVGVVRRGHAVSVG
jgi:hypothetical protein